VNILPIGNIQLAIDGDEESQIFAMTDLDMEFAPANSGDTFPDRIEDHPRVKWGVRLSKNDWYVHFLLGDTSADFLPILNIATTGCVLSGSSVVFEKDTTK